MDRQYTIDALGADLAAAAASGDWSRLEALERTLASRLPALAARGPWSASERDALARLRAQHDAAEAACGGAALALAARLDEMRTNKEGWIAYALESKVAES